MLEQKRMNEVSLVTYLLPAGRDSEYFAGHPIDLGDILSLGHRGRKGERERVLTPTLFCCRRTESLNLALAFLALREFE